MTRITTFCFTAEPSTKQQQAIERHVGARRFAFNQCLALVKEALDKKKADPSVEVPLSGFSLINAVNELEHARQDPRQAVF